MDARFDRIDESIRDLRVEMNGEFRALRGDLNRFQDRIVQIGYGMALALFAALITAILAVA